MVWGYGNSPGSRGSPAIVHAGGGLPSQRSRVKLQVYVFRRIDVCARVLFLYASCGNAVFKLLFYL